MSKKGHLLMVEDKESLRKMTTLALEGEGYRVTGVGTVADGIRAAQAPAEGADHDFDLVLSDLRLPDGTGIEVLDAVKRHRPEVPVIMMTAFGTVGTAVEAMKLGAADFLEKPVELDELFALIDQWLGSTAQPTVFQPPGNAPAIVGSHPRLRAALRLVQKVAPLDSTVLLAGESGTGKELFARAVHGLSKRADGPFVAVNCAAIPESLMENELFGHEKGAFTGASQRQPGRFELAAGGTLFLDEIGELKPEVQGKVLRVLEEKVFERVGGGRPIASDARVVAATNRNLKEMVATGQFRQDLFYRLEVFPIELPTLKDRNSDIPDLVRHLASRISDRLGLTNAAPVPDSMIQRVKDLNWPGNVRQLANFVERALILSDGSWQKSDIDLLLQDEEESLEDRIRQALLDTDGDKKEAAGLLDMSYRTLQRRIKELDLEGFPKYRS